MKKFFKTTMAVMIGLSLTFTACKKDEGKTDGGNNNGTPTVTVPQSQKATVIYFGGTWCPPCGAYGKPAKEQIKAQTGNKAVIISCQVGNDPMANADGQALSALFNPSGVPAMYLGGADDVINAMIGGSSNTGAQAVATVGTIAAKTAKSNIVLSVKEEDGLQVCTIDGKFFADLTGEYYAAGYLLEDKLKYAQSSDNSVEKDIHYNVLRAKYGDDVKGELIKANPKKDETFNKKMAFFIPTTSVKANCAIAVVIWKKQTDGKWTLSNSSYIQIK